MSNRTLIEINHDLTGKIDRYPSIFVEALVRYLNSAGPDTANDLREFGIRVFGMRHHSDAFSIDWGGIKASEKESSKR